MVDDLFRTLTLEQFLEALHDKGKEDAATEFGYNFMFVALMNEIPLTQLLSMTLREFVRMVNIPEGKPGWNNMWGEKVLYPDG